MTDDGESIFDDVPSMRDEPVVWDKTQRRFVAAAKTTSAGRAVAAATEPRPRRPSAVTW